MRQRLILSVLLALPLLGACNRGKTGLEGDDSGDVGGTGDTAPPAASAPIYVHADATLYTWSPGDAEPVEIGAFHDRNTSAALGGITDIAIDADGALFGVIGAGLFRIDPTDAAMDAVGNVPDGSNGLTFLPDGRLLVAGSALVAVDLDSGATEAVYTGGEWSSSGDVVAIPDGTVHWSCVGSSTDRWVIFDPTDGSATLAGDTSAVYLWGVAYADDQIFAFDAHGGIWEIDGTTGASTRIITTSISYAGATTNPIEW
jgi:hypothetical protein